MDIMITCWNCSYGDSPCRIPLKDFDQHNFVDHEDCAFKCHVCPNVFYTKEDLDLHMNGGHDKFVCTGCFEKSGSETMLDWDAFRGHYADFHKFSKVKCQWCPNKFHHPKAYEEHRNKFHVHVPRNLPVKIKCINCHDGYSAERDKLELHNAAKHNPKRYPYQCTACGNVFERSAARDEHSCPCITRTHDGAAGGILHLDLIVEQLPD